MNKKFNEYVGMIVVYRSNSGINRQAVIIEVSELSQDYPIVTVLFKLDTGKTLKIDNVHPITSTYTQRGWIYTEGKYLWKEGLFTDEYFD